ncbi:mechanosensitive ion channel family protein [Neolewinella antarctica]|uniref:Small-conductance mechanosensitive channel n=1 Tax=Neolewinella antarctica TaxID=442734 RepID=A0ABX0XDU2_9BACT|nr:mechanosensitive ion channel domain-containing protein [Neolewinella antarctica]NJC27096.1 small-conductance mechanosensitive channel [Neolewinella antarctica]
MQLRHLLTCIFLSIAGFLNAQATPAPVVFKSDTLFYISNKIGTFQPQQRADRVGKIIGRLSKLPRRDYDSLTVATLDNGGAEVLLRDEIVTSISPRDSATLGVSAAQIANERLVIIRTALIKDFDDSSLQTIATDVGLFLLASLVLLAVFYLVNKAFNYARNRLRNVDSEKAFSRNWFVRRFDLITPTTEQKFLLFGLRMLRYAVLFLFLYLYLPWLFSHLTYTRGFGERLLEYVLRPLQFLFDGITGFLPGLLFIIVIIVAVRYLIGAMKQIAFQVKTGKTKLDGFYPDWALPTFNIARVLVIIFTLVIIFPYLPGSGSDAFQGVSVFVGLLLSLGSAGIIGNVISGVILTYMRPFVVGDRVKIGEVTGDVIGKTLLVTRIKTVRNEEVTIPNGILMGGGVVNYSALAEAEGLVLHTSITIGYDVPWPQVHELMIAAAMQTDLIATTPPPFVLQKALNDWYVEYELNAYTHESHKIARMYSDLHANIQDVFNAAGVEIMSSHYMAVRDGNGSTIPVKK